MRSVWDLLFLHIFGVQKSQKLYKNPKSVKKSKKCTKIQKVYKNPKNVQKSKDCTKNPKSGHKSQKV